MGHVFANICKEPPRTKILSTALYLYQREHGKLVCYYSMIRKEVRFSIKYLVEKSSGNLNKI